MEYFVYVLRSERHSRFYTGLTQDFDRRLKEHNSGKTKSTKAYKPWKLVLKEEYDNLDQARQREKYLKSGAGREYVKDYWTRSLPTAGRHN